MTSARTVFEALKTFNRPATRIEISNESGLDRDGVHAGLKVLKKWGCLIETGDGERFRGLYQLDTKIVIRWKQK